MGLSKKKNFFSSLWLHADEDGEEWEIKFKIIWMNVSRHNGITVWSTKLNAVDKAAKFKQKNTTNFKECESLHLK